jgi:hypothetical protein
MLRCPSCGSSSSLELEVASEDEREFARVRCAVEFAGWTDRCAMASRI